MRKKREQPVGCSRFFEMLEYRTYVTPGYTNMECLKRTISIGSPPKKAKKYQRIWFPLMPWLHNTRSSNTSRSESYCGVTVQEWASNEWGYPFQIFLCKYPHSLVGVPPNPGPSAPHPVEHVWRRGFALPLVAHPARMRRIWYSFPAHYKATGSQMPSESWQQNAPVGGLAFTPLVRIPSHPLGQMVWRKLILYCFPYTTTISGLWRASLTQILR